MPDRREVAEAQAIPASPTPSCGGPGPERKPESVARPFFPSHLRLLEPLATQGRCETARCRPDAIVVPTGRGGETARSGLRFAARLAVELDCPLVVLVSYEASTRAAVDALGQQVTVAFGDVHVRPDTLVLRTALRPTGLTRFQADGLPISTAYRRGGDVFGEGKLRPNDVGRKRNQALLLARSLGWRSVLFLDDDIFDVEDGRGRRKERFRRTLDAPSLRAGVAAVEQGALAVGWAAKDFDDNSVLCRIAAWTGSTQDQFIGGGALLVRVDADVPYFPSIYNEDWLFVLALLERQFAGKGAVLHGGEVHQDPYDPFPRRRAAAEELGDVLGEGMLSVLHADALDQVLLPAFWRNALTQRRLLKDRLRDQVGASGHPRIAEMQAVLTVLDTIHARLLREEEAWLGQFVGYVRAWRSDLQTWRQRLSREVPPARDFVHSKEFDSARTFGESLHPDDFLARHARRAPVGAPLPIGS